MTKIVRLGCQHQKFFCTVLKAMAHSGLNAWKLYRHCLLRSLRGKIKQLYMTTSLCQSVGMVETDSSMATKIEGVLKRTECICAVKLSRKGIKRVQIEFKGLTLLEIGKDLHLWFWERSKKVAVFSGEGASAFLLFTLFQKDILNRLICLCKQVNSRRMEATWIETLGCVFWNTALFQVDSPQKLRPLEGMKLCRG